jgi:hypothetical protein
MQTLELKSIYKFCKSCSSSRTEHNKIGLAIFVFFYDFILNLQVTAKTLNKGRIILRRDPWKFRTFTDLPLVCTQTPGKKQDLAMWSLGAWGGAVRRIPARPAAGLAGEEVRLGLGAPRSSMAAGVGVGRRRQGVHGGATELRPRARASRRREDWNQPTSDGAGFSRCLGAVLRGWDVVLRVERWDSASVSMAHAVVLLWCAREVGVPHFIGDRRLQGRFGS